MQIFACARNQAARNCVCRKWKSRLEAGIAITCFGLFPSRPPRQLLCWPLYDAAQVIRQQRLLEESELSSKQSKALVELVSFTVEPLATSDAVAAINEKVDSTCQVDPWAFRRRSCAATCRHSRTSTGAGHSAIRLPSLLAAHVSGSLTCK